MPLMHLIPLGYHKRSAPVLSGEGPLGISVVLILPGSLVILSPKYQSTIRCEVSYAVSHELSLLYLLAWYCFSLLCPLVL